jgi:enterochelin esterase family protein
MARHKKVRFGMVVGLFLLAAGLPRLDAQVPRGKRKIAPKDAVVSPEVLADRKVTFRIWAPKATEVTLRGDWMEAPAPVKLEKGKDDIWSVTVGPLVPDFYSYSFSVDGVRTVDPRNPTIKQGIRSLDSMFFLPGKEASFQEHRDVPHGEVRQVWYRSATLRAQRRMHIYTPPGYEGGKERYPVLYLLHGGGDEDSGWSTVGRAGFILDNLLADKKARPMLVVMPNGSLPRPADEAPRTAWQDRFTGELLKEIVPFVEKNYRVQVGAEHRALGGLSMGGGQTLRVVTTHPDQFGYVAVWSAGLFRGSAAEFEKQSETFLKDAEKVNKVVKLFSIRVGDKDFALTGSKNLAGLLKKHGIKHELGVSGGGHTWINWRHYLNELAPKLFR